MVGILNPTEIEDLTVEIGACLSQWASSAGIRQTEIIELTTEIIDIINNHLYNGGE